MTEAEFIDYANGVCAAVLDEICNGGTRDFVDRLCRAQLARMVAAGDICARRHAALTMIVDDILRWEMATRTGDRPPAPADVAGKPRAARAFSDGDFMEYGTCPISRRATAPTCT